MKTDQEIMQSIREAIDDCTKGVEETPSLLFQINRKVRGEEPVTKKISTSMILAFALVAVVVIAIAAGANFGWTDFYSENYGIDVPDTAQRILEDSILEGVNEYTFTLGNATFSVGELYCDGYTALASTKVALTDGEVALITGDDPYDSIGLNSESGNQYAKKLGVTPDTTWVDAAKELDIPLYVVRTSLDIPQELVGGEFMEGSMISEDGDVTCFSLAVMNGKAYGETVDCQMSISITKFDVDNPEKQSARLSEQKDIKFYLDAPIDTMEYDVPQNLKIQDVFQLDSMKAVWMPGGLYVVTTFTALNGAAEEQAYELLDEIEPVTQTGEAYSQGMNLTGNIQYHDEWPKIEMVRMITIDEIPEIMTLAVPDGNGESVYLSFGLK